MAEKTLQKKGLKNFLVALVAVISIGYAIAFMGDPFIFILYIQLAFLFLCLFLIKTIFKDFVTLAFFLFFILAFVLEKVELSFALGILFFVIFTGRTLIKNPRGRRILTFSSAAIIAALFFLFISPKSSSTHLLDNSSANREAIQSLPYAASVHNEKNPTKQGAIEVHPDLSAPGLNLYNSYYQAGAYLLDMSGNILHEWLPYGSPSDWHCVAVCDNGDLLVCIEDAMLMRLDWDSHVIWQKQLRVHHDIAVAENKDIYTLASSEELVFNHLIPVPVINDSIVVLSSDGAIKKKISLFNALQKEIPLASDYKIFSHMIYPKEYLWRVIKQKLAHRPLLRRMTPYDVFHNNTVTMINKNVAGLCKKGDVLIAANALNLIGIIDTEKEKMRWTWGQTNLQGPHNPTFLDSGHILIFDDGTKRASSRVLELDPLKNEIVWEYHSPDPTSFFSDWGGSAQQLPNGNTLVTDTSQGKVFEITRDGEIVWEFFNPDKGPDGKRATIYRMTRITDPHHQAILLAEPDPLY